MKRPVLTVPSVLNNSHFIVGAGGQCLCGVYDGEAVGCQELIREAMDRSRMIPATIVDCYHQIELVRDSLVKINAAYEKQNP